MKIRMLYGEDIKNGVPHYTTVEIPDGKGWAAGAGYGEKILSIRKGPGTDHAKTGRYTGIGTFTIVAEADGEGAFKWGLQKSYQGKRNGWISLDYGF